MAQYLGPCEKPKHLHLQVQTISLFFCCFTSEDEGTLLLQYTYLQTHHRDNLSLHIQKL
jgi:hypothetical protein